ncbi:PCRF domain-containing protein, partial [Sphingomonadaceae bacterium]|nr:PCRF domain-containing protein [Sphingomonadaceae bacterium]
MKIPEDRLRQITNRFAELEARMASGTLEGEEFVKASRDYAELEPVANIAREVSEMRAEIGGLNEMLADPEMKAMAQEELAALNDTLPAKERALAIA